MTPAGPGKGLKFAGNAAFELSQNPPGTAASYVSAPLGADTAVVGAGALEAWVKSPARSVDLQATVTEVRSDGQETFVQSGWLRASLRKLDAKKCSHAIGLGASQSAGIMANFGSMAKPFHAGRAAQAGVMAARLAAAGFTAQVDAIEHPQGFLAAVSPRGSCRAT